MKSELLLGDEAVGQAAIDCGIAGAFSYPGTPATEIFEFIQAKSAGTRIIARWSSNEKVAYEEALGMSFVGKRAIVSMKHVGLNVAADPFMSSALTGARGGLVVAVADDPGMHSSQNEQDSRFYGDFAHLPVFEPSTQQEAYDMTCDAFELSEHWGLPILLRLVTRLSHSRASIHQRSSRPAHPVERKFDWRDWTLLPVNARRRYRRILGMQQTLTEYSEQTRYNKLQLRGKTGCIACGLAWNYVREALGDRTDVSLLKLSTYPPPVGLIRQLAEHCHQILIVEEGYPFVERQLRGVLGVSSKDIRGRLSGHVPASGELTVEIVQAALSGQPCRTPPALLGLPDRPPRLCDGCPHCDSFNSLTSALGEYPNAHLFSDIGCYTLGALPPYNAVHACVDMGASISMGHGAAKAGAYPVICTIGDSTFIHSGMTGLIGAAHEDADMTVIIMDNATIAMTGGQAVFASGEKLVEIVRALGVKEDHIVRMDPRPQIREKNAQLLHKEIQHHGLSVVIASRPCIQSVRKDKSTSSKQAAQPAHATVGSTNPVLGACHEV